MTTTPSLPEHIAKPHLRPVQPIPAKQADKQLVVLRDPTMISRQTIALPPQLVQVVQLFQGERTLDQINEQINADPEKLEELAKGLDKVGLLWGPTFEQMEADLQEQLKSDGAFPLGISQSLGEDPEACRAALDKYFADTEDPELDSVPSAIVAPHLDYPRGWPNYAAAYYAWKNADIKPDRIVVLGSNHFGLGDGAIVSEHGFKTPFGTLHPDRSVIDPLFEKLGRPLWVDQLDLLPEHSIELQLPWIQYCFGDVPVVAALVPDPIKPMIEDDGGRVDAETFIRTFDEALQSAPGTTFFVASADLSHVGPQFGEPRAVDAQRKIDVEQHDRELMGKFLDCEADEFLSAVKWNKNPTRWCGIGSLYALLTLAKPKTAELLDYRQAGDEQGRAMVSSTAIALFSD